MSWIGFRGRSVSDVACSKWGRCVQACTSKIESLQSRSEWRKEVNIVRGQSARIGTVQLFATSKEEHRRKCRGGCIRHDIRLRYQTLAKHLPAHSQSRPPTRSTHRCRLCTTMCRHAPWSQFIPPSMSHPTPCLDSKVPIPISMPPAFVDWPADIRTIRRR